MKKLAALAGIAALGMGFQTAAHAYSTNASVTVNFGGSSGAATSYLTSGSANSAADIGWTGNGSNEIVAFTNATYITSLGNYNSQSFYNADFASTAGCAAGAGIVPGTGTSPTARKYGCRYTNASATASFAQSPQAGLGPNGSASGTITVTDTTMTGVLTIVSTTDLPTGGTTSSVGDGTNGYNYRTADGSPFGNAWYGVTTAGTYTLNLTGTFTASSWDINGGAATFKDTVGSFLCQQGGNSTPANILCTASTSSGGFQTNGAQLSWGVDLDGSKTAFTSASGIPIVGSATLTLSGVLASLSVDANGNITTNSGEFRKGSFSAGSGCASGVTYNGTKISCGTLSAGSLSVTGNAVPVPAAVWLGGSALGLLGALRRKRAA